MSLCPLGIYTDRAYIPKGTKHCLMLIPFWGDYHKHNGYARFERDGKEFLRLTSLQEAEVAVLPFDGSLLASPNSAGNEALESAHRFVSQARSAGLRTVIILNEDSNR